MVSPPVGWSTSTWLEFHVRPRKIVRAPRVEIDHNLVVLRPFEHAHAPPQFLVQTQRLRRREPLICKFHSAIYLADGIVYTKNGKSPILPWTLSTVADVAAEYSYTLGEGEKIAVSYYRQKGH